MYMYQGNPDKQGMRHARSTASTCMCTCASCMYIMNIMYIMYDIMSIMYIMYDIMSIMYIMYVHNEYHVHHVCHTQCMHMYPCLAGERRHLLCINFKDSPRPAELPRWLSWYSICLERRRSRVRVPPEAALWKKRGVVFGCRCLHLLCLYN